MHLSSCCVSLFLIPVLLLKSFSGDTNTKNTNTNTTNTNSNEETSSLVFNTCPVAVILRRWKYIKYKYKYKNTKNTNSLSYLSPSCSLPPEMNGCTAELPPNANWKGFFFEKFLKSYWFVTTEWTNWQKNTMEVWPLLVNGHLARIFCDCKLCDLTDLTG